MATRAVTFLKQKNIPHQVIRYRHLEKGAAFAAGATGYPIERTVKTLVAALDQESFHLALLPGHRALDLKKLAAVLGARRSALVDTQIAERLTGYHVGGISPFATRRRLPIVMEARILDREEILINAGQRGVMLKMAPADIASALDCRVASIQGRRV